MEPTDHQLLAAFRERQCESSFRQLVARHAAMVFATARRIIGDPHRAEEVSQGVFLLLASKAGEISGGQPVAGWLYHTTRHRSLEFLRSETRRQNREQIAADMQSHENAPLPAPLTGELEAALADLQPEERDVLVLRYLEDRQLREVGCELGISEQAAQKRVARALESLRGMFERRGITLTSGALATLLAGEAAAVVPPTLIASATAAAVGVGAAAAAATTITQGLSSTMNLFNLKTAAAILATAAVTGTTTYLVQEREVGRLRADYQTLHETHARMVDDQQAAQTAIQLRDEQLAALRKEVADLPRLQGAGGSLNFKIDWNSLDSTNHQRFADNLKTVGFPDDVISDLVAGRIRRDYDPKLGALERDILRFEYWQTRTLTNQSKSTLIARYRDLLLERDTLLASVPGGIVVETPSQESIALDFEHKYRRPLYYLGEELRQQITSIQKDFHDLRDGTFPKRPTDAAEIQAYTEMQAAKFARARSVLGEELYRMYFMEQLPLASFIRQRFSFANLSQSEFDTLLSRVSNDALLYDPYLIPTSRSTGYERTWSSIELNALEIGKELLGERRFVASERAFRSMVTGSPVF